MDSTFVLEEPSQLSYWDRAPGALFGKYSHILGTETYSAIERGADQLASGSRIRFRDLMWSRVNKIDQLADIALDIEEVFTGESESEDPSHVKNSIMNTVQDNEAIDALTELAYSQNLPQTSIFRPLVELASAVLKGGPDMMRSVQTVIESYQKQKSRSRDHSVQALAACDTLDESIDPRIRLALQIESYATGSDLVQHAAVRTAQKYAQEDRSGVFRCES